MLKVDKNQKNQNSSKKVYDFLDALLYLMFQRPYFLKGFCENSRNMDKSLSGGCSSEGG